MKEDGGEREKEEKRRENIVNIGMDTPKKKRRNKPKPIMSNLVVAMGGTTRDIYK